MTTSTITVQKPWLDISSIRSLDGVPISVSEGVGSAVTRASGTLSVAEDTTVAAGSVSSFIITGSVITATSLLKAQSVSALPAGLILRTRSVAAGTGTFEAVNPTGGDVTIPESHKFRYVIF